MQATDFIQDIRKGYPVLEPDRDYPPLQWRSIREDVSEAEWQARVDCACAYRLVKHFGMDDLIYNHISVRIPGTDSFLLNAFGLLYEEITASSLIKINLAGEVLWAPELPDGLGYQFNPAGWVIHAAIHEARPELEGVIHTHSLATMAVSTLAQGLLPITQTAMRFEHVGYHDYEGVVLSLDERDRLLQNLGQNEIMFLRNHGVLAVGRSIAEAFNNCYRIERACKAQLLAAACSPNLVTPPASVVAKTHHMYKPGSRRPYGVLEWPAMRRLADRIDPSYKQ